MMLEVNTDIDGKKCSGCCFSTGPTLINGAYNREIYQRKLLLQRNNSF